MQTNEVQKLLEEFEDDQLQLTLELEAYERERVQLVEKKIIENQVEQINISDEEWLEVASEHTYTEEEHPKKQVEQLEDQAPKQQRTEYKEQPWATEEEQLPEESQW